MRFLRFCISRSAHHGASQNTMLWLSLRAVIDREGLESVVLSAFRDRSRPEAIQTQPVATLPKNPHARSPDDQEPEADTVQFEIQSLDMPRMPIRHSEVSHTKSFASAQDLSRREATNTYIYR